ncbi:TPA: 2OG-Fe(II) oxygenase [Campylobacter coli]|nr:hypothetical protein BOP99_08175 [Campylobacter coli]HEB9286359.1 2OG-Fe(II) oxygenase [Campylobacter coli]
MELWNWKPNDDEYRKFQHTNIKLNYGLDRSKISLPYTTYKPKLGEIVLFNPRYVHAVKKVNKGIRLTISCFLGVNKNEELVVWS